jgi:hypothetical protein
MFKLLRWVQRNPLIIFELLVDLDEILYERDDTEYGLDSILFNAQLQPFQNGGCLNF